LAVILWQQLLIISLESFAACISFVQAYGDRWTGR
jgi:hypothetical protein